MNDGPLRGRKVAILVHDYFEEVELTGPKNALETQGATVHVVSPKEGELHGLNHLDPGDVFKADASLDGLDEAQYDALIIPGGVVNSDHLRVIPEAQSLARAFIEAGKPTAVICHGPWLLVSAGLVRDRTLTSYHTLADDITNAGGEWVDEKVVIDSNLITSRKPDDLQAFTHAIIGQLQLREA